MTQAFSLKGYAYLSASSRRLVARIDVAPHEGAIWVRVIAEDGQEIVRAPLVDAKIDTALGRTARKLIFNDLSDVKEEIIFNDKIGRIRDIQVHPNNGKIYFLAGDNLWSMGKS